MKHFMKLPNDRFQKNEEKSRNQTPVGILGMNPPKVVNGVEARCYCPSQEIISGTTSSRRTSLAIRQ